MSDTGSGDNNNRYLLIRDSLTCFARARFYFFFEVSFFFLLLAHLGPMDPMPLWIPVPFFIVFVISSLYAATGLVKGIMALFQEGVPIEDMCGAIFANGSYLLIKSLIVAFFVVRLYA